MATTPMRQSLIPFYPQRFTLMVTLSLLITFGHSDLGQVQASPVTTPTADDRGDEEKRREILEIARTEYQKGLKDFKAERYRDALQKFVRVYRLKPHPNLVYNMARSFEQLKEYKNAAEYYQKYLDINPNAKDRGEVEITIKTMEKLAEERQPKDHQSKERRLMRRVGWGGVALGSALIVGGSLFGVRALNGTEELNRYGEGDSLQGFNAAYRQRDQAALFADVLMVSGVAISSLGLYFALRPDMTSDLGRSSSVSLSATPNALFINGAF